MATLLTEQHKDRLAGAVIRAGGLFVIVVVIGIVVNIGYQAVPLFLGARQGPLESFAHGPALAVGSDPRRETPWALRPDGTIDFPGSSVDAGRGPAVAGSPGRRRHRDPRSGRGPGR